MSAELHTTVFWGVYVRESTEGQIDGVEYNGLDSQESVCRKWVASQGPNARVYGVYSDVESGTSFHGRDGLKRLLHDAEHGKIQGVVAYELDRWARNLHDYGTLKKQFAAAGVPLRSASVRFDDSAEGKLMESELAGFAEYFSDLVSRKVKTKRAEMAAKGMFLGGGIAFGYAKEAGKIVVVDAEAVTIRLIFDLFVRERSAAVVRHQLRARGIKNRAGKEWNNTNIAHILRNRFYVGELSNQEKVYRGPQEPLIASELFDAVQAMRPVKRRAASKMERPYPLVDVLHCGNCGTRLSTHYVDRGKWKVPYYRYTQTFKKTWGACPIKQVNADKIEAKVLEVLNELSLSPGVVRQAVEAANTACSERETALRETEQALKAQVANLSAPIRNLVEVLKAGGTAALAEVSKELERLTGDKALAEHELWELQQQLYELRRSTLDAARSAEVIGDLRLLYEAARPDERRELVRLAIKRIVYSGPAQPLGFEFFDGGGVNLPREGSKLSNEWLRLKDSNLGPGG